jgi:outer membrane receptor for ferrienterochelin and colicin
MSCTYAKTRNGDWAVIGPEDEVAVGARVAVITKAGVEKTELVCGVSRPFDGKRFGYLIADPPTYIRNCHRQKDCPICGEEGLDADTTVCWECGCKFDVNPYR